MANSLNFKPIVLGTPSLVGGVLLLARLGHSLARVKLGGTAPTGTEIWSSEKVNFGGYDLASRPPLLVDQSSPDFFDEHKGNCGRSNNCQILNIFIHSGAVCRQSMKLSEIGLEFVCFWP